MMNLGVFFQILENTSENHPTWHMRWENDKPRTFQVVPWYLRKILWIMPHLQMRYTLPIQKCMFFPYSYVFPVVTDISWEIPLEIPVDFPLNPLNSPGENWRCPPQKMGSPPQQAVQVGAGIAELRSLLRSRRISIKISVNNKRLW